MVSEATKEGGKFREVFGFQQEIQGKDKDFSVRSMFQQQRKVHKIDRVHYQATDHYASNSRRC